MPGGFFRVNGLGSPFRAVDAGYNEYNDKENDTLFAEGVKNYMEKLGSEVELDRSMFTSLNAMSPAVYPMAFSAVSYAVLKNYTRPRSIYFRGFWTGFAGFWGWWGSVKQQSRVQDIYMMKNYKYFNADMRDALATGDSRYLREFHSGPAK